MPQRAVAGSAASVGAERAERLPGCTAAGAAGGTAGHARCPWDCAGLWRVSFDEPMETRRNSPCRRRRRQRRAGAADRGVAGGDERLEDLRPARRAPLVRMTSLMPADAAQRRASPAAGALVRGPRLRERELWRRGDEGVQCRLGALDAREHRLRQLGRGQLAGAQTAPRFVDRQRVELAHAGT